MLLAWLLTLNIFYKCKIVHSQLFKIWKYFKVAMPALRIFNQTDSHTPVLSIFPYEWLQNTLIFLLTKTIILFPEIYSGH